MQTLAVAGRRSDALFADRMLMSPTEPRRQLERFHEPIVGRLVTNPVQTVWQRPHDERGLEVSVRTFPTLRGGARARRSRC